MRYQRLETASANSMLLLLLLGKLGVRMNDESGTIDVPLSVIVQRACGCRGLKHPR